MVTDSERQYWERLQRRVQGGLRGGARSLEDLLNHTEGAFPTDVAHLAPALPTRSQTPHPPHRNPDTAGWPEPHPARFEWRFTEASAMQAASFVRDGSAIACLGCPTVFVHLLTRGLNAALFDRNVLLLETLKKLFPEACIVAHDLRWPIPPAYRRTFDTIVADPPWYPAYVYSWVARALEAGRDTGADLYMTQYPPLTRPSAIRELREIQLLLERVGLVETLATSAQYDIPGFEKATMESFGLELRSPWRRASWVRVRLGRSGSVAPAVPQEPSWLFMAFGTEIVALRADLNGAEPALIPLGNGGILRTVSARDPDRIRIGVWTSRNSAFEASGGKTLVRLFALATERFWDEKPSSGFSVSRLLMESGLEGLREYACTSGT